MVMVDQSKYKEEKEKFFLRILWKIVNHTIFRSLPGVRLARFRNSILRFFGASIAQRCNIYSSVTIFAPWNLEVGMFSTIGPGTILYNKGKISIGEHVVVSQRSHLCTASHNIGSKRMELIVREITIRSYAWVASEVYIGPGVEIGEGAVASARSAVFNNVEPKQVVRGNPAIEIDQRRLEGTSK